MTLFDYLKAAFAAAPTSPWFSISNAMWGATSGVITWCLIFPIESIRRRLQTMGRTAYAENYEGILDCINKVWTKHGVRGFYLGLLPAWYKVIVSASVLFAINEKLRIALKTYIMSE